MDRGDTCRMSLLCVLIADAVIIRKEGCKSAAFYIVHACLTFFLLLSVLPGQIQNIQDGWSKIFNDISFIAPTVGKLGKSCSQVLNTGETEALVLHQHCCRHCTKGPDLLAKMKLHCRFARLNFTEDEELRTIWREDVAGLQWKEPAEVV